MRKTPHLRAVHTSRNGRPARRRAPATIPLAPTERRPVRAVWGAGLLRRLRRALGEVVAMAVVLALAIVLAHAMLVVFFPV
jgi:hypothetical protein